ncbi:MAG TPA: adenylate kinase [Caldilineae bacterium]|nr:adenylate kinase [Caldilineae bacterium]
MTSITDIPLPGRRILVVGTSGSGKTTLAADLAARLHIPHYELDALHWGPDWYSPPREEMRRRVAEAAVRAAWVIDGNYSSVQDLLLARADTIVWLDYALPVIMWQLLRRTVGRVVTQEELWAGNRESLMKAFFSRESILLWALQTYRRRRRQYTAMMADPDCAHLTFIHLRSPRETRAWLATFG